MNYAYKLEVEETAWYIIRMIEDGKIEEPEYSREDELIINNHLNEIAALPEEKFSVLVDLAVKLNTGTIEIADILHPDQPGKYDLSNRLIRDVELLSEIIRRARGLRDID